MKARVTPSVNSAILIAKYVQAGKLMQEAACQSGGGSSTEVGFQYTAPDNMSEGDKEELLHSERMKHFLDMILPRSASRSHLLIETRSAHLKQMHIKRQGICDVV